jgi:hypothetical protein
MTVSIVIPVYNQLKLTVNCLKDVLQTYGVEYEIIVVDDCSAKEPISRVIPKLFPSAKMITNTINSGFAKTCNAGIRAAKYDLVCLLNNDTRLPNPQWLALMVDELTQSNLDITAVAGCRMDKNWNYQSGEVTKKGEPFSYLAGWALLVKKEVFGKIGLIPENFGFGYWEDVLFCHRAKKVGFKLGITENTQVQHKYHTTFLSEGYNISQEYQEKRKIFLDIIRKEK